MNWNAEYLSQSFWYDTSWNDSFWIQFDFYDFGAITLKSRYPIATPSIPCNYNEKICHNVEYAWPEPLLQGKMLKNTNQKHKHKSLLWRSVSLQPHHLMGVS